MSHSTLVDLLQVSSVRPDIFIAPASFQTGTQMFGGQFLAQAIASIQLTVESDRTIHSLHAYFLRPGDTSVPIEFRVSRTRDGRSFSHRSASAYQNGKEAFRMIASYAMSVPGHDYVGVQMPKVPPPEEIDYTYEDFCRDQMPEPNYLREVKERPMEILYINPPQLRERLKNIESQRMWIRIRGELTSQQWLHDAALAYISDSTLIDHITIPHGKRWQDPDFEGTSLDHGMWFHRPCLANEWLLFDQHVEWTGDGRGLVSARLYSREGKLIATCIQEGLMRFL